MCYGWQPLVFMFSWSWLYPFTSFTWRRSRLNQLTMLFRLMLTRMAMMCLSSLPLVSSFSFCILSASALSHDPGEFDAKVKQVPVVQRGLSLL